MLNLALEPAKTIITSLAWVERYGGLVNPIKVAQQTDAGIRYDTFPVRRELTQEQCKRSLYELAPNHAYLNLLYCEQIGDMKQPSATLDRGLFAMSGRVRLFYWLNLQKMGLDLSEHATINGRVESQLIAALSGKHDVTTPQVAMVEYSGFSSLTPSPDLLKQYSYDDRVSAMLLYPFSFGAIEFTVDYKFSKGCLADIVVGQAIECVNWNE